MVLVTQISLFILGVKKAAPDCGEFWILMKRVVGLAKVP
jgi:hypothetical protein